MNLPQVGGRMTAPPVVHFRVSGCFDSTVCNCTADWWHSTDDPNKVTCKRCRRTKVFTERER